MAYYFQKIDTLLTPEQRETEGAIIYNLDEFHTIKQLGTQITAHRGDEKPTYIVNCKTVEAAQHVMSQILEKRVVPVEEVIAIEEGTSFI